MNLWLRLIAYILTARFRPALTLPADASTLDCRVWPGDLDPSLHMNNGRYLTLMDLGRLDIMVGSGLWRAVLSNGWTPIASTIAIRYRRELRLWQRFRLETRLVTWDDTAIVMEQLFVIAGGPRDGQIAARALFKGGLYDRRARAFVPTRRLMEVLGVTAVPPPPADDVAAFLAAEDGLRTGA